MLTDTYQATWVFVVLGDMYDIKRGEWRSDSHSLLSAQELWFAVFMTILFVHPPLCNLTSNNRLTDTTPFTASSSLGSLSAKSPSKSRS